MPAVHGSQAQPDAQAMAGNAVEVYHYQVCQLFKTCNMLLLCFAVSAGDDPALGCPVGAGSGSNGTRQLAHQSADCQHRPLFAQPQQL